MPGTRYVNVRTNNLIETRNEGDASFTIVTVTGDGYGPPRRVRAASFHENYLASDGQPYTSGYVPVRSLPGDHPHAMKTEIDRMELLDNLDKLSEAELAELIAKHQKILSETKALIERAKAVAKKRRKEPGLELHGGLAMVYSTNDRFDEGMALRNLSTADLHRISVSKPDAATARLIFKNEPEKLKACMKSHGLKLEVREATDEDRLKVLNEKAPPVDDEVFELENISL
ncbi:hypothetical protein ACFW2V_12865 [Streptomyces sp. NPDC058947]|uniref:hypothetical protein n=1 Tax=Streptomyces sp. NPDC058947 TaxID=3346675 RepID=UPI0036AA8ED5